jgi:hypothetical protein
VAQDIRFRTTTKADKTKDELTDEVVETDEVRHTKFVAVPGLGVFAVDDSISDRSLGARSAVGRFEAIVETLAGKDYEVRVAFAGTAEDAQRALDTWTLDQFSLHGPTIQPNTPPTRRASTGSIPGGEHVGTPVRSRRLHPHQYRMPPHL